MTTFQTLASGSGGNAALLSHRETRLLIDMGISCRRVCQALAGLGYSSQEVSVALKGLDLDLPLEEIVRQGLKRMAKL